MPRTWINRSLRTLNPWCSSLEDQQIASLTEEDKDTLQKYAEKQKELQEETEEITETADKLSDQNPFMDEQADRQLDLASKSMGEAKEKLKKPDVQGAVIDRESLYRLAEAKKGMEMAKERIAKGMMGTGIPMPMSRPFHGRMDEGQFGASTEKSKYPPEEAYRCPREFRQDILDALKKDCQKNTKTWTRTIIRDWWIRWKTMQQ